MNSRIAGTLLQAASVALAASTVHCAAGPHGNGHLVFVREESSGIAASGQGEAEAPPDTASFTVGVEVRKPTAAEARETAAAAQQRVMAALQSAGIAARDVQTTQLSLAPDFDYAQTGRRLLGYVATNAVRVRTHALDRVGPAADAAATAGGEFARLDGVRFEIEDSEALHARARERAVANARRQGEQFARLLGARLGEAVSVEQTSASGNEPEPRMMRMEAAQSGTPTPVAQGTIRARVEVRVRWAIAR